MQKTFILDTNVLIQAPQALLSFDNNEVVLPLVVLVSKDILQIDENMMEELQTIAPKLYYETIERLNR